MSINVADRLLLVDYVIHKRLGERRLVELVVTHLSVTDQVNENILIEFLSVLSSNFENFRHIFQSVCIDVEDWSPDCFGEV